MPRTAPTWFIPAITAGLGLAFLLSTGVDGRTSALAVAVVGIQGWSGAYAWSRITRGRAGIVEAAGMGLALGTAAAVVSGLGVRTVGLGSWGWALPAAVALAGWVWAKARHRSTSSIQGTAPRLRSSAVAGLVTGAGLGLLALVVNLANYPLTWSGRWDRYHPDMLFFEALGTSLARFGPLDSVFLSGGQVRYHWLVYAWSGQVAEATAAAPFVVLTRVLPFTATAMVILVAVGWAARLSRVPWVPALAVTLVLAGGYVGATYGTILNFDSPSQAVSTAWLLAMCLALLRLVRRPQSSASLVAALLLLSFATSGGKISSGAIGVAALGVTWLGGAFLRAPWQRRALAGFLASAGGLAAAYLLIVSGSADPGGLALGQLLDRASSVQGLNPLNSALGIVLGTMILAVAIAIRWAGAAWIVLDRGTRATPLALLAIGLGASGTATVLLVSGGLNDTWFALAASAPLSIISAVGVGRAASAVGAADSSSWVTRPLAWAVLCGLGLAGIVTALWLTGGSGGNVWVSTMRWLGPPVALFGAAVLGAPLARQRRLHGRYLTRWVAMTVLVLVVTATPSRGLGLAASSFGVQSDTGLSGAAFTPREPFVDGIDSTREAGWTASQAATGAWLNTNASPEEIVVTNVTFSPLVPALSGMRTWVSGTQYQAPYGRPAQLPVLLAREAESWGFLDRPTATGAADLCRAGVRWAWVDPERTSTRSWAPWAAVVRSADDVLLLRLDPANGQC